MSTFLGILGAILYVAFLLAIGPVGWLLILAAVAIIGAAREPTN